MWRSVVLCALCVSASAAELRVLEDDSPAKLTGLGNEALVEGRFEIAIAHYRRALERDPRYAFALFNLAVAHQQLGQFAEARTRYEQVIAIDPGHSQAMANLAWLDFRAGDADSALRRFTDAARLASSRPAEAADHWFNIGAVRSHLGQQIEARRAYEQCIALESGHAGARYNLGSLLLGPLHTGPSTLALAREHLEQAVQSDPRRTEAWLNLALCRERQNDPATEEAYDRAVASAKPDQVALARWTRARWYARLVPPRAIAMRDDLIAVLTADPQWPEANGRLGAYLHAIGDFDGAITHLEREVAESADQGTAVDIESHFLLAEIYTDRRPDAAKALFHATACQQAAAKQAGVRELVQRVDRALDREHGTAPEAHEPKAHAPAAHDEHPAEPDHHAAPAPAPAAHPQSHGH